MACTLQLAVVVDRYALSLAAGAVDVKPNASKVIGNKSGKKDAQGSGFDPPLPLRMAIPSVSPGLCFPLGVACVFYFPKHKTDSPRKWE